MDREDIRLEIRRLIQDTDTTNPRWSDTVLNDRIDTSHRRIACLTKCVESRDTFNSTDSTAEYTLDDNILEVTGADFLDGSVYKPLKKTTEAELDNLDTAWRQAESSLPTHFYQRADQIGIYPCPSETVTDAIRINTIILPTDFSDDTDTPFDDIKELYPYHDVIAFDVASVCKFDEGDKNSVLLLTSKTDGRIREIMYQMANKQEDTRMPNIYELGRRMARRTY